MFDIKKDFQQRLAKSKANYAKATGQDIPAGGIQNETKTNKIATGIAGTAVGIFVFVPLGLVLILIGLFLTMTIIGAIIGIPLILAGIATAIIGPFGGLSALQMKKAKCPYCETVIRLT